MKAFKSDPAQAKDEQSQQTVVILPQAGSLMKLT
jgi:hypothetical protein